MKFKIVIVIFLCFTGSSCYCQEKIPQSNYEIRLKVVGNDSIYSFKEVKYLFEYINDLSSALHKINSALIQNVMYSDSVNLEPYRSSAFVQRVGKNGNLLSTTHILEQSLIDDTKIIIKKLQEDKALFHESESKIKNLTKELNTKIKLSDSLTNMINIVTTNNENLLNFSVDLELENSKLKDENDKHLTTQLKLKNSIKRKNSQTDSLLKISTNLELENSKLEDENEKHLITQLKLSETIKEKNLILLFAIIALILAGIAFWQAITVNKQREKAEQQNKIIKMQQKELSHRIKNNLQELNSYLDIQKQKTTNETTKQELSKSQQLIVTFGNIHKFLYRNDSPEMVNIQDYFKQFIGELINAAPTIKNRIKTSIQVSDVKLPTQQVFYMALAINELITNAFKYAYNNIDNPELLVQFNYAKNGNSELVVKDNGCGLPADYNERIENSMGTYIIETNVEQLYGSMDIQTGKQGTTYNIKLDLSKKVA
jgi:two-component sensor histidine kinase